ncbi:RNA-binding cell elongation regulator Jag/EloR [Metabacillus sediminilitoris]|uniref:RNA-binding protein KhpB n=1 Tax=Metabacillus sediminilitoris TaxID=2567941 RepID=A0A4S4BSH6_9BACI|nr:RNA-binding cell elongation regulator Jag/EloR [Metabacillus sediminilitoris]QGQ48558.1 KH domain-containing protein [Metabacillus sediminilitoris]THF77944.1 protein jag [Metabacillus sediminilitoris]
MNEVTANGLTVNEAVEEALKKLKADREEVEIIVVDEGRKGIFGIFGKRSATVKVTLIHDPVKEAQNFLSNVMEKMGIDAQINVNRSGKIVTFQLTGDKLAVLIGKRGQTLNSLQYLTQLVANRYSKYYIQIVVDAENYRSRRKDTLNQLAERLAKQAIRTSKNISLEPMPSYERKIIHAALSKFTELKTYSVGEEPNRHLVISPKRKTDSK